jgi:Carboxypeptidase regulatory-like domain
MNRLRITLFAVLFLTPVSLLMTPLAFSQTITTADVVGVVSDSSGAIIPGAKITIKSLESGESRTETTNGEGQYRFPLMKPGDYEISADAKGLKSNLIKVTLLVGQAQEANITMNPAGTSTTVEVNATAAVLQTENANLESNFNKAQVDDLPMPGGDLTTLAMTTPGIRVNVTGGSSNMNANGIPGASILYTLDGMDQNDPANNINNSGASNNLLGANAVGEVAVVMNAYSPQYGRMAGAQVNMVGLTGTNQYHGNLFYNFNWEQLNANAFFNNSSGTPRGRSDAHQFGGRVGGPVKKNKLFFFFDHENLRYVLPAAGVVSLPSPQLQTYALAHVGAAELPLYQDYFKLVNGSPGINRAVPVTNGTGLLQDGNNHLGCGINTFYKTPTGTGGTFGVDTPCAVAFGINDTEINTEMNYSPRVDWNISDKQKLFFKFDRDQGIQATGTSPINSLYNAVSTQPANQGNITDSWIISPTMVNNVTASFLWYSALFGVANFTQATQQMPEQINISDGGANGGGFANVGGGTYPYGFPVGRNVGHFQINDDFSWIKGTHTLKAGVNARFDQYTYSSIAQSAFVGTYALGDLADFANGKLGFNGNALSTFSQTYPLYGALHFRFPSADFYLSDDWAVTKRLKLTYGIRVEEDFNPYCIEKCFVLTNVPFNSPSYSATASTPYSTTLEKKSDLFYNTEGPIVQPRVGFAYQPFSNGKTVIRGGIGLFATNYTDGLGGTLAAQVPNKFTPGSLNFGTVGVGSDSASAAYTAQLSANAFQTGFNSGYTLAQIQTAVKPASFSTPTLASFPETFRAPKDIEWSFEIQQQVTKNNMFTASYVGNHGYDLQESVNANMYALSTAAYTKAPYSITNYGGLPSTPADPRFTTVTQYYNNGISNYNALTLLFRHMFSYGLTGQIHFTWSHDLGTIAYENPFNLSNSYASLGFDNRYQAAADVLWNQPFRTSNGIANALIKGWTVAAKLYVYSGAPFSVTDSKIASDVNSTGVLTPIADLVVPTAFGMHCNASNSIGTPCMPKTDFATYPGSGIASPVQTDWGNTSPDSFRGPGYFDIDMTIERTFTFKERFKLMLGMQAYNVLNHPNFALPSGTITSGSFGEITSTLGPPTSIYGTGQGAAVSGRLAVLTGRFSF